MKKQTKTAKEKSNVALGDRSAEKVNGSRARASKSKENRQPEESVKGSEAADALVTDEFDPAQAHAEYEQRKEHQKSLIDEIGKEKLLEMLYQMILGRRFEEKCAEVYRVGKIGGFCHLYIGQEAVAIGALAALEPKDMVIASYR